MQWNNGIKFLTILNICLYSKKIKLKLNIFFHIYVHVSPKISSKFFLLFIKKYYFINFLNKFILTIIKIFVD